VPTAPSRSLGVVALAVALGLSGLVFAVLIRRVVRGETFGWDASGFRLLDDMSTRVLLDGATKALLALGGEYWDPPPLILVGAAVCALGGDWAGDDRRG